MSHQRLARGLYAITGSQLLGDLPLETAVEQAIRGGARVIQYRDKSDDPVMRQQQAKALCDLCHQHSVIFIVNDDVSLAQSVHADGVHLGRDDPNVRVARDRLGKDALIGISCYNEFDRALEAKAMGADYVAFGRFFPSQTKPHAVQATTALLQQARKQVDLPIVAIGGITAENGAELLRAGATLLAVINGLYGKTDPEAAARAYREALQQRAEPGWLDGLAATLCSQGKIDEGLDIHREATRLRGVRSRQTARATAAAAIALTAATALTTVVHEHEDHHHGREPGHRSRHRPRSR